MQLEMGQIGRSESQDRWEGGTEGREKAMRMRHMYV